MGRFEQLSRQMKTGEGVQALPKTRFDRMREEVRQEGVSTVKPFRPVPETKKAQAASPAKDARKAKRDTSTATVVKAPVQRWENQLRQAQVDQDTDVILRLNKKLKEERARNPSSGGYSLSRGVADIFKKGANQVAQAGANTLALAEDVVNAPFELFSGMELGSLRNSGQGIFNPLREKVQDEGTALAEKSAVNVRKGGKGAALLDKYGTATVAAVPQSVIAMLTGGTSTAAQAAAQTSAGVARQAAEALSPGIARTLQTVAGNLSRDPQFWSSFSQVVGSGYQEALEDGTSVPKAALYAVGNGLMNAAVEVGGGVQTLPGELQAGASGWRSLVDSALDEGKEEVIQGVIERAMQNLSYQKGNPLASVKNPDAVFNPLTAAEEFAGGAVVGGISSGGQIAANRVLSGVDAHVRGTLDMMQRAAGLETAQEAAQRAPGARQASGAGVDTTQAQSHAEAAQTGPRDVLMEAARRGGKLKDGPDMQKELARFQLKEAGVQTDITEPKNITRYRSDIDKVFSGEYPSGKIIEIGTTPQILQNYGANSHQITLTQDAAYKIAYPQGYMGGKHNLGMSVLKQIPYQLADPVAILRSASQPDSLVIVTAWKDGNTDIVIPLHLNKQGALELENRVASVYGKGHIDSILGENGSNILYTKNHEDIHQLLSKGVQFPQAMADDILARNTIPESTPSVKPEGIMEREIRRLFGGGKRLSPDALTAEQMAAVEAANGQGTVDMDAENRLYQVNPEEHIDRRDIQSAGDKRLRAFQFDHPQLHPYYVQAAQALSAELEHYIPGGETASRVSEDGNPYSYRMSRSATPRIAELIDRYGVKPGQIGRAIEAIINDRGQENYAAAKRLELMLDEMLTNGYQDALSGEFVQPNREYIDMKGKIAGAMDRAADVGHGLDGIGAADAVSPQVFVDPEAPENDGLGNANKGFDSMSAAERIYGVLPDGEKAARPDDVPARTTAKNRVSLLARTIKGAGVIPDSFIPSLEKAILDGGFSYIPITNTETAAKVQKALEYKGWAQARAEFSRDVAMGRANEEVTAMGELLANAAANADDTGAALEIMMELSQSARSAGRAIQAVRILKNQSPAGRLYMIQKSVQSMVDAMNLPEGSIKLDEDLLNDYLNAQDDAARDKVISEIQQSVADQLPSSLLDKWTALRYVNMLGNFKTQVRNIFGNAGMQGVRAAKDLTAASLEKMYSWVNPKVERTKTALVGKDLMEAAKADYVNVADAALGEGKYKEGLSDDAFARGVEEKRTIFKNNGSWGTGQGKNAFLRSGAMKAARTVTDLAQKPLEGYRNLTNWAMTQGDVIFTKHSYARALAGYLKANKITAEQFSSPVWQTEHAAFVDKARQYAIKEAQEATFRDSNLFSNWVSQIGRGKRTPKPIQVLSEGLAPFRKTPANVLVRAEEYSPLGFANTIYEAVQAKRGNATSADVINSLSKSLTGTALFAVGMALFKGLIPGVKLRGSDDDDDKQRGFDDLTGHQSYSLELANGFSCTLDWLAPGAMPFFMGVELEKLMEDQGLEWKDLESALTSIAEPMLQMSMLQSVNDTLDNLKFSEDNLGQMAVSLALNYLTQGLTNSLVGQVERIFEEERQSTYVDKNSAVPSWLQREIGKASAKTPGWDYHQIPYLDAWGREEETGDALQRAFNNMINPAYVSQVRVDQVERELQRLKDATGNGGVFPSRVKNSFTFTQKDDKGKPVKDSNGNNVQITKNLTASEYQKYAKKVGQTQFSLLEKLMEHPGYQRMDDTQRQKAIAAVYEYASVMGKLEVSGWNPDSSSIVKGALKFPLPTETYILYRVFADRDGNGSVSGAESAQTLMELDDLTNKQRGEAWGAFNDASAAKNPFSGALSKKLEPEDAMTAWGIYDRKGTKEEPYTQERKKQDLRKELGLSYIDAAQLYELMKKAAKG